MATDKQTETPQSETQADSYGEDLIIVEGAMVETNADTPPVRRIIRPSSSQSEDTTNFQNASVVRLALGSVLIAADEIGERAAISDEQYEEITRTPDSVLMPESEWDTAVGNERFRNARYLAIGLAEDTRGTAGRTLGVVNEFTDTAGRVAGRFLGPVWNSFLLAPIRRPVNAWQEAGEGQVKEWIAMGRTEEARSRAVAETSLTNLVQESVEDITTNDEIQVMIQQVVAHQSLGMFETALVEVRERLFSLDLVLSGIFGRAGQDTPPFRGDYLDYMRLRDPAYANIDLNKSMAGHYAGFVTRFAGFSIDLVVVLLLLVIGSAFAQTILTLFGLSEIVVQFLASGSSLARIVSAVITSLGLLTFAAYMVISWSFTGVTLGDYLAGVRVLRAKGGDISFWRAVLRMIGFYLSGLILFLGFIWAIIDRQRRGWHDILANTTVIYNWPAQPDENFLRHQVLEESAEAADYQS